MGTSCIGDDLSETRSRYNRSSDRTAGRGSFSPRAESDVFITGDEHKENLLRNCMI